jgi:uncharacterized protein
LCFVQVHAYSYYLTVRGRKPDNVFTLARQSEWLEMDALALLRQHEPYLKKRFGVGKIGIFGSFVRGEERPESDVDILVTFRKGQKSFENYMGCKFYLEDLFKRRVDLVMKNTIKTRYRPYILGEVVYA